MRASVGPVPGAGGVWALSMVLAGFLAAGFLAGCAGPSDRPLPGAVDLERVRLEFPTDSPGASGTAVLEYPIVRSLKDPTVRDAVNARIGPAGLFEGRDAEGLRAAFAAGERPFDEARAEAVYNGRGILQVVWRIQSTGSYTAVSRKTVTVDTRNGALLGSEYMFRDDLEVVRFVQPKTVPALEEAVRALVAAHPEEESMIRSLTSGIEYTPDLLFEAELREDGMVFVLPLDFPHAFKALEGEPVRLFIPWKDLKPFSYPGSILERFPAFR